jgi:hypothetical protein
MSKPPSAITWAGLAGGFVGVGVLIGPALRFSKTGESPHAWIGMMILLCSSLIWSVGSLYSRKAKNAPSPFLAAGQQMLCGGTLLIIAGTARGELHHFDPRQITMQSLGAFAYLVLIGEIIVYVSYAWLLRHCDPAKVATYAYVNPIVAVFLGAVFAGRNANVAHPDRRRIDYRLGRGCNHGATDEAKRFSSSRNHKSGRVRTMKIDSPNDGSVARRQSSGHSRWRAEVETALVYRDLAERESDEKRKGILLRMAEAEGRHAALEESCATWVRNRPPQRYAPTPTEPLVEQDCGTEIAIRRMEAAEEKHEAEFRDQRSRAGGEDVRDFLRESALEEKRTRAH